MCWSLNIHRSDEKKATFRGFKYISFRISPVAMVIFIDFKSITAHDTLVMFLLKQGCDMKMWLMPPAVCL